MEATAHNTMFEESNLKLQKSNSSGTQDSSPHPEFLVYKSRTLCNWIHPSNSHTILQKLDSCFVKIWMYGQPWIQLFLPPVTWHSKFEESSDYIFAAINWFSAAIYLAHPGTSTLWFTLKSLFITTQVRLVLLPAHPSGCMDHHHNNHKLELQRSLQHLNSSQFWSPWLGEVCD